MTNTAQVKSLSEKFINSHKVESAIRIAISTQKNLVLYGPGGHGKSEMVSYALSDFNPYTLAFGEGMTEERLFGGVDLRRFRETGEVVYNYHNSFIEHEIVVFEEMFDAPTNILLVLKDILTSKTVRNGNEQIPIKTKTIIVCTNRSAEEIGTDLSSKALLERFPLRLEVKWDNYDTQAFKALLDTVLGAHESNTFLAGVFESIHKEGGWISPRTAVHAAQVYRAHGIDALEFIDGITQDIFLKIKKNFDTLVRVSNERKRLEDIKKQVSAIQPKKNSAQACLAAAKKVQMWRDVVADIRVDSSLDNEYRELMNFIQETFNKFMAKAIENVDEGGV